jgi:glycosyltransferase involved in cell wall biosynthesis
MKATPEQSLLIYIPTYNRYDLLVKQIRRIEPFIDGKITALYISDNCSTDSRYLGLQGEVDGSKVKVVRNPVNLGANVNIANGFLAGSGFDFLWILSDDDIIGQQAVVDLRGHLDRKMDLMYMQHGDLTDDRIDVLDMNGFLRVLNNGLGLISRLVYRSEFVSLHIRVGFDYINSGFPHLAVLFSALANGGTATVQSLPYYWFFADEPKAMPVESATYIPSLYGFVRLADFISDSRLKHKFLSIWIYDNSYLAIYKSEDFPVYYKNLLGYLFAHSFYFATVIWVIQVIYHVCPPILGGIRYMFKSKKSFCQYLKLGLNRINNLCRDVK